MPDNLVRPRRYRHYQRTNDEAARTRDHAKLKAIARQSCNDLFSFPDTGNFLPFSRSILD